MTTTFHLERHAAHDRLGQALCGRIPGIALGPNGRDQANRLAEKFARRDVASVHASPLVRALQTAEPIAERLGRPVEICEEITEIEYGSWAGSTFEDLAGDPDWAAWNSARATNRPPGGESMIEVQGRIVKAMEQIRTIHRDEAVVLVSHGDVIKAALLYHLGLHLDAYTRLEVEPASVNTLVVGDWGAKVIRVNEVIAP